MPCPAASRRDSVNSTHSQVHCLRRLPLFVATGHDMTYAHRKGQHQVANVPFTSSVRCASSNVAHQCSGGKPMTSGDGDSKHLSPLSIPRMFGDVPPFMGVDHTPSLAGVTADA